jgi:entericidin B
MTMLHQTRLLALLAMLAVLSLGACNTFRGVGEDVEAGGEAISGAAQDSEDAIEDAAN